MGRDTVSREGGTEPLATQERAFGELLISDSTPHTGSHRDILCCEKRENHLSLIAIGTDWAREGLHASLDAAVGNG